MALLVGSHTDWDDGDGPGGDEEWKICNDNGFVYKRRRRLLSDNDGGQLRSPPPSSSRARESENYRVRKKKTLLSLRDKYRTEFDQWQQLSASPAQIPAAATSPTEALTTMPPLQLPRLTNCCCRWRRKKQSLQSCRSCATTWMWYATRRRRGWGGH